MFELSNTFFHQRGIPIRTNSQENPYSSKLQLRSLAMEIVQPLLPTQELIIFLHGTKMVKKWG